GRRAGQAPCEAAEEGGRPERVDNRAEEETREGQGQGEGQSQAEGEEESRASRQIAAAVAGSDKLRIALGQLNLLVGDVAGNARRIAGAAERACGELSSDLLVLTELTLSGYPPEDLLFHRGFRVAIDAGLETVRAAKARCGIVLGFPEYAGSQIFNSA